MKMKRGRGGSSLKAWIYLGLVYDPCFRILAPRLALSSQRWTPIIYIQTPVLCLRGVKCALMAERWAACLKGQEGEGGQEGKGGTGVGVGGWKSILYTDCLPGWLSIRNCKSFPLYLTLLPPPPPPPLSTSPVLTAESKKWLQNLRETAPAHNWTKHQTENDKAHTHAKIIATHPPSWLHALFHFPLTFTTMTGPFQKTQ